MRTKKRPAAVTAEALQKNNSPLFYSADCRDIQAIVHRGAQVSAAISAAHDALSGDDFVDFLDGVDASVRFFRGSPKIRGLAR